MKKYVKPVMIGQKFVANEYIASCGDSGVTYKFFCTAGHRDYEEQYPYKLYDADGNLKASGFEPCYVEGDTDGYHEADSADSFFLGYLDDKRTIENDKIQVYVWAERIPGFLWSSVSYHCTTNINKNEWETAKS